MNDLRKLIDIIAESSAGATVSGGIAGNGLGFASGGIGEKPRKRVEEADESADYESEDTDKEESKDEAPPSNPTKEFKNAPKTETVTSASDYGAPKAPKSEKESADDPQGTPKSPEIIEYGNWQNSALVTSKNTKSKRGEKTDKKPVKEATEPEQQAIDSLRSTRLRQERQPHGSDKIDAMLAQQNAQRQEYEQTGKFWLKTKQEQKHIDGPFVGKQAANRAALELLKQSPEFKGNLVITAYGPDERQDVGEGKTGPGLWANIRAKKDRGERMRKKGEEGAPTEKSLKAARAGSKNESVDPSHQKILDKAKTATPRKPNTEYDRKVVKHLRQKHSTDKKASEGIEEAINRKQQAAIAIAKKKEQDVSEGIVQIDELSKDTVQSYLDKAKSNYATQRKRMSRAYYQDVDKYDDASVKSDARKAGIKAAKTRLGEEGVAEGQLDEFGGGGFPKTPNYNVGDSVMVKGYQGVGKIAYIKQRNDVGVIIKEPSPLRVVTTIDELIPKQGVAEGVGNFAKAMDTLGGWYQERDDEGEEVFYFDDREGGYYAEGIVKHDSQTGEVTIDFEDKSGEYGGDISGTFNSIGDAMKVLRGTFIARRGGGKAHNFDTLGGRTPSGPEHLYKTDKAGKKGTLTKNRMDIMKASSPSRMRGSPVGVLPESQEDFDDISETREAVESAIIRRIQRQRTDLLKFGPGAVMDAVTEVADDVASFGIDEIGSSDVSGWIKRVEEILMADNTLSEAELSEEQLRAKKKREELFKRDKDKDIVSAPKPRNFVVKNQKTSGAGSHKDKKRAEKQGDIKHKKQHAVDETNKSQLGELSSETLASYKKKAGADASAADKQGDFKRGDKRFSGIVKATKKEFGKK